MAVDAVVVTRLLLHYRSLLQLHYRVAREQTAGPHQSQNSRCQKRADVASWNGKSG
jgi:hypothetical protein